MIQKIRDDIAHLFKRIRWLEENVSRIVQQQECDHRMIELNSSRIDETKQDIKNLQRRQEFELPQPNWED